MGKENDLKNEDVIDSSIDKSNEKGDNELEEKNHDEQTNENNDNVDLEYNESDLNTIEEWEEKKPKNEAEEKMYTIDIRLSEIEALKFDYEATWESENPSISPEKYDELILEEKELYKQKRELGKTRKRNIADNTPLWIILYGIIQAVVSSPVMIFIQISILNKAAEWEWLNEVFSKMSEFWATTTLYTILFIFPIINFLITLIIYFVLKKGTYSKKAFKVVLFGHLTLMIISAIIAIFIFV